MNKIENTAPEQCTVRQAAYVVRHGSRYVFSVTQHLGIEHRVDLQIGRFPDTGSYGSWVALHDKVFSTLRSFSVD